MDFQEENISKMKLDILLFGNVFKRYIANVNQADAQMLSILFELIGDIDGFIQHQHTFPTVHELEIDMRLIKCSTALSCTACMLTFGTTYQSYTKHMRVCKPAKKNKVDPAPSNAIAKKATKIVMIPKIPQSEIVFPPRQQPRERLNSTASNTTTSSFKTISGLANKNSTKVNQPKNTETSSSKSGNTTISVNSSEPTSSLIVMNAKSSVNTNQILTKNKPSQANVITQIFNSNTNTASKISDSLLRRNSSDSQTSLPAPQPIPQTRAENPFKIPSPDGVLGFQEPLKNVVDSTQKTLSEISVSSISTAVSEDLPPVKSTTLSSTANTDAAIISFNENLSETTKSIENLSAFFSANSSVTSENENLEIDDISSNEEQHQKALKDDNKCKPIN